MTEIRSISAALFYVAQTGSVVHTGKTLPGQRTRSGQENLSSAETENEYMALLAPHVSSLDPMPAIGEPLEAGRVYAFNNIAYMVRQNHNRTEHDPSTVSALFFRHRVDSDDIEWIAGEWVDVGAIREYGETSYTAIQAHQTQNGWEPPNVPALWAAIPEEEPETSEWTAGVTYAVNDEVEYQGLTYRCVQAHTAQAGWTPVVVPALWQLIS